MKHFFCLLALLVFSTLCNAQVEDPIDYVAHEWGTFTTVHGSDGSYLSGLYKEEEHLPNFVYSHSGFSPDPSVQKGLYKPAEAVTVKMETPVIYFYSDQSFDVEVKVDFPNGSISQWYPQRNDGEENPINKKLDFSSPYEGWIGWNAKVLGKNTEEKINTNSALETPTWVRPRETDANLVKCGEEIEKFLFYRGIGNFELPLSLQMTDDQTLSITNSGKDDIGYAFVYEKWDNTPAKVWWTGGVASGKKMLLTAPDEPMTETALDEAFDEFVAALVDAGLFEKEARSMLNTWHESYFNSYGVKIFWIVPTALTEEILPMELEPKPSRLARVLVGRSEVLTPSFETQLAKDINEDPLQNPWVNDRYYLAYKERAEQLLTVDNPSADIYYSPVPEGHMEVFPNPAEHEITILVMTDTGFTEFEISNSSGAVVLSGPISFNRRGMRIDIDALEAGVYHIKLNNPDGVEPELKAHSFVVVK